MLGVLLDFWEIDRKAILQNGDTAKPNQGSFSNVPAKDVTVAQTSGETGIKQKS
jgi:hypothetical protein